MDVHGSWTALLAAADGEREKKPPREGPVRYLLARPFLVAGVLSGLAFVLGIVGALMHEPEGPTSPPFLHAVYVSLQNFALHGPYKGDLAWPLDVARFLAPFSEAWAGVAAFLILTEQRRHLAGMRRSGGHTIVLGLGAKGTRIASESVALGERVVAIEKDEANMGIRDLRAQDVVVLVGDATDPGVLERAGAGRARYVVAALPGDADNLAAASAVRDLAEAHKPAPRSANEPRLRCFVHCADLELSALARRARLFNDPEDAFELHLFSRDETAARILATDHLPSAFAAAAVARRRASVAIVGLGTTSEAVLLRILESPHLDGPNPLDVTILALEAQHGIDSVLARYRIQGAKNGVYDLCTLLPVEVDTGDAHLILSALADVHQKRPLDLVVVCLPDDDLAAKVVLAARTAPFGGADVHVRMHTAGVLRRMLLSTSGPSVFGEDEVTCTRAMVVGEVLDTVARRIHDGYRGQRLAADVAGKVDVAQRSWHALDPDLMRSNVSQADHIPMKLAVVGKRAERGEASPLYVFSKDEVETLARLEHARWVVERILSGWRFAPGKKDVANRTNPSLVGWEGISEEIREYDREPVRALPQQLSLLGLRVVPR